jgi:hypothetical protein
LASLGGASLAAALLIGCASGGDGQGTDATPPDRLTVIRNDGRGTALRIVLECEGGDRARCADIAAQLADLEPNPSDVCAEIFLGRESISLSGQLDGDPVSLQVDRSDSCGDARYRELDALLRPESG